MNTGMTWTEVKQKWWHRLAITVTFLTPAVFLACVVYLSQDWRRRVPSGETVATVFAVLPIGIWATYRLVLWIVLGKIAKGPKIK